jgi:hypothetical protein
VGARLCDVRGSPASPRAREARPNAVARWWDTLLRLRDRRLHLPHTFTLALLRACVPLSKAHHAEKLG